MKVPAWGPVGLLSSALLFMTWQRRMPAWEPVGLLSSDLLFMTWQRVHLLVFSQCSAVQHVRVPAWAPVNLLSSVLLFMTWQREGASLGTSWFSQQCSAVHDMAT